MEEARLSLVLGCLPQASYMVTLMTTRSEQYTSKARAGDGARKGWMCKLFGYGRTQFLSSSLGKKS